MAVLRTKFLEPEEVDRIHEKSLESLRDIGVLIPSPPILERLDRAGATVDPRKQVAYLPEGLVTDALAKAPKRIRYASRDGRHDFEIPSSSWPFVATNGLAVHIADLATGKDHSSTRADLARFSRLGDALDAVDYLWTSLTATDVPKAAHGVHELWTTMQNTVKHVESITVLNAEDAKMQIALASLVAGGPEQLRKRPLMSVVACPIAPLMFERGAVEAQVEFARAGVPVLSMSMSLGGATAPVTLAGTIANVNTENLASLVIDQVAAPGCPHVYTSDSTPVNMQTGAIDYAAVESPLIAAGATQMARRYGLPCMVSGWGSAVAADAGLPSFSELNSIALAVMSGTDLSAGVGGIDRAKGCSYEMAVVDAYLWEDLRAVMRSFSVNDATIALDVVKSVGHGDTFLRHPHTARTFRKELHFRNQDVQPWEATLSDRMIPEAREIAARRLREHEVPPLDKDVRTHGDALIHGHEKALVAA